MTDTLPCPACGAPNEPIAGASQMACTYCGANLTIPAGLRRAATPKVETKPARPAPAPRLEEEAPELLRQAQSVGAKALNTYAWWTWIRRTLPACLVIALIVICACIILGASPFILQLGR